MRVRETAMERYGIEKTTKAIELLYARNGMTAEQKFDAIQGLFTEITEHVKQGDGLGFARSMTLLLTGQQNSTKGSSRMAVPAGCRPGSALWMNFSV